MNTELKKIPILDIFILMISGDRLANNALIQNMKILEVLCGGIEVW